MTVHRVKKDRNYTIMSNYHLQDKNLSYKAKGMLSFMLSLPDNWKYSIEGLVYVSKESKKAISNILNELEHNNYLKRCKFQNEKGQFYYDYIIYEIPFCDEELRQQKEIITKEEHNKLTFELVNRKYIDLDDIQIYYYDKLFDELLKDYEYKQLIVIIHYILRCLKDRNYLSESGKEILNKYGYFKEAMYNNIQKLNSDLGELYD